MNTLVLHAYALPQAKILHNKHINKQARKSSNFSLIDVKYSMWVYS